MPLALKLRKTLTKVAARGCQVVISISFYSDALIFGTLLTLERLLLPGLANTQKQQITLSVSESFIGKPAKPEFISQTPPFLSSYTLSHYSHAIQECTCYYSACTKGCVLDNLGTAPIPQSPLKLFKLSILYLLTLPHLLLPIEITIKALIHSSSFFSLPPD